MFSQRIGANPAVFAITDHVLLRPLPFADSARLVRLWESRPARGLARLQASPANYLDWKRRAQSFDAVWSSHVLEHLYAHEVYPTLEQFHHVLKPDGFALIMSPDLESVAQFIIEHGIAAIAYHSPAGPIRPLDMLYGHSRAIEEGRVYMAHRTAFTKATLASNLTAAGFGVVGTRRRAHAFDLWAVGTKGPTSEAEVRALMQDYLRA